MLMRVLVPTGRTGDLVEIGEIDLPDPAADETLVKVSDFALNRADYLYLRVPGTAYRPGIDAVGTVEVAAVDGSGPGVGTRVAFHLPSGGAAAEYVAVLGRELAVVPDAVAASLAAALPMAGLVARRLLALAGALDGRRILGTGVGGGVGQVLIQLARAAGAEFVAVVAEDQPTGHITALGAGAVHDIDEIGDGTIDIVVESVGGSLGSKAASKLRAGGLFLWFGEASGEPLTLDFFRLLQAGQSLTLRHFVYSDNVPDVNTVADIAVLLDLAAQGQLTVEIGRAGDWDLTAGLIEEMAAGRLRGKAVLTVH
jgi:NADPH:quinone reductase